MACKRSACSLVRRLREQQSSIEAATTASACFSKGSAELLAIATGQGAGEVMWLGLRRQRGSGVVLTDACIHQSAFTHRGMLPAPAWTCCTYASGMRANFCRVFSLVIIQRRMVPRCGEPCKGCMQLSFDVEHCTTPLYIQHFKSCSHSGFKRFRD